MNFKHILFLAIGFGLFFLSRSLELQGDLAPLAESGVSPERAKYHLMALVALLGALGFFISVGVMLFRKWRR